MGHIEGVSCVYRRFSENQLRGWYLKGEPSLLVFEVPVNQQEIDDMKTKMEILQNQMMQILEFLSLLPEF